MHILGAFIAATLWCNAAADDGNWSASGGPGSLAPSASIQMVSEVVRIRLGAPMTHVRAVFHFLNHGNACKIRMAFPERFQLGGKSPAISRFASWVDGRRVHVIPEPMRASGEGGGFSRAWVKSVTFAARGRRTVTVEYDSLNGETDSIEEQQYILTSAATWAGPIKRCTVIVDWRTLSGSEPTFELTNRWKSWEPSARDPRRHVFKWRNLTPDFDIECFWTSDGYNFFVNGVRRSHLGEIPELREGFVRGRRSDPWLAVPTLVNWNRDAGHFGDDEWWTRAASKPLMVFGHALSFPDRFHMRVDGRKRRLTKPLRRYAEYSEPRASTYVRLVDVVTALGGTYRYNPATDRGFLQVPTARKARKRSPK